ncbi:hypothetical protein [Novosphingobium aureum]|nr:hypothetical protein [Novosphingobium aureum]
MFSLISLFLASRREIVLPRDLASAAPKAEDAHAQTNLTRKAA